MNEPVKAGSRRNVSLGCALVLVGLVIMALWTVITGLQLLDRARSLQSHLQSLEQLASGNVNNLGSDGLESAGYHLDGMRQDLAAIESQVRPLLPIGRLMGWIPTYGGDLAVAGDLLDMATGVSAAGDRIFRAVSPALDLVTGSQGEITTSADLGEQLLPVLMAAQPELQAAQQDLAAVKEARARIETQTLSPRVSALLERLDQYLPWFETAVDGALLAPDLLGAEGPRTYLLLAQNNQELRATGGFISGVGELRIHGGRLVSLEFSDSYAVDNLQVPHELTPIDFRVSLLGDLWFFRDTNWNADFPTSARRALEVYAQDRGTVADGVITLDLSALGLVVDALGPLQVDGIAEPVTGQNIQQILQSQWAEPTVGPGSEEGRDAEWWLHRKDFMGQIAGAAFDKLLTGQGVDPIKLARNVKRALDEKRILIYLSEPQAMALLRERNWDGALPDPGQSHDVLLVIDSNVGFNKVDVNIERSIRYHLDLGAAEGPRARLTISYRNQSATPVKNCVQESRYGDAYADMMDRCYWDYVRVYTPADSQWLAGPEPLLPPGSLSARTDQGLRQQGIPAILSEDGWTLLTNFFALEPGGQQTLSFEYQLPEDVQIQDDDGLLHYQLRVQKQPGTVAVPFELTVTLPPGAESVRAAPSGMPWSFGTDLDILTDLRVDREFEIVYRAREE